MIATHRFRALLLTGLILTPARGQLCTPESRPLLVLLNAPVDTRSRAARAAWWTLRTAALRGEPAGWLAGAAAYPLEVALARVLREGPSTEIMVCRRPVAG